jgi:hypothetical protein
LIKGVVVTMFIRKLRLAASSLLLAALGIATAASALLAHHGPSTNVAPGGPDPVEIGIIQEAGEAEPQKSEREPVHAAGVAPDDAAVVRLEEYRVEAEMLQIQIDAERAAIEHSTQFLQGLDAESHPAIDQLVDQAERDREKARLKNTINSTKKEIAANEEKYREHRIKLALLNRRIARESKALGTEEERLPALQSLVVRLDRLEGKLDRILAALASKRAR